MGAQELNDPTPRGYLPELVGGATDTGPTRAENQDTFWIPEENTATHLGSLILVADGVGGQEDGAVAAQLAARTVHRVFYERRQQGESVSTALKNALERANQAVYEEGQNRDVRRMGSTFVAAVQDEGQLIVAHVGDARAYLVRKGAMRQLTRDDTWVQRQVDAGLITEEEAARHEFRNVVTQVLGNKPEVNVNLSQTHALQQGDIVLLCSDGLYDVLEDSRMVPILTGNGAKSAARLLVEAATDAEATDNITAVVMRMEPFLPLADETTLVPPLVPDADEPTTVPTTAPTIPVPPPAVDKKDKVSKWLILLAIIAVILIVATPLAFWLTSQHADGQPVDSDMLPPTEAVSPTQENPAALKTIAPTVTSQRPTATVQSSVATIEPLATVTIPPPATALLLPTPTILVVTEPRGCVNDGQFPYVWNDNQITNGDCGITEYGLGAGAEVRILSDQSLLGGGTCGGSQFLKIQSVANPAVEGWMREALIDEIEPGESCSP
jgi:protein phosphatase